MLRIISWAAAGLFILWILSLVLPPPFSGLAPVVLSPARGLAWPLFILSLCFAPGLDHQTADELRHVGARISGRKQEVAELQRRIAQLDRAHHMLQLAMVYLRQGRRARAEPLLEQALEKEPDLLEAKYRLALCRFEEQRYEEAAALLEDVHAEKPDHDYGVAYLRLAQSHHRLGNQQRAAEIYSTLLRFYPGHPEGSYDYGMLLAQQGDTAAAARQLTDMIMALRGSPAFQRRRNRHWTWRARWWLWRHGSA